MIRRGTLLLDIDYTGVPCDDLGRILRELPEIFRALDDLTEYAPFVRASKVYPGLTELTQMGETFSELRQWLQYQHQQAYQALRQLEPSKDQAEYRALDLVEYIARHSGDLAEISLVASTLKDQPEAVFEQEEPVWVARYLSERATHV